MTDRLPEPGCDKHLWSVWRQDDLGQQYEITRGQTREAAERLLAEFEAKGHKQTYWLEKTAGPAAN